MKKYFFLLVFVGIIASISTVSAQNVLDGVYAKDHVANRKPIPYPHVREADVMWSKKVWRVIDLREKINLSLYYPLTSLDDRVSLIQLLINGIQYEGLKAYSTKYEDEFKVEMSFEQVRQELGAISDTMSIKQEDGTFSDQIVSGDVRPEEVKQFMVKEVWYFDKNYSRMDVRIIGICPIREYVKEGSNGGPAQVQKKAVCWVYFPEARDLLARHEVFNSGNDAQRRTFDDIFMKRYFGSYIVRESNVYNNRRIDEYAVGVEAMLESNRIKTEIFNFEHDLWEF
ncbi:type IX secretion system ring subunit PorN/GldN [Saccharicrinis aurantiacus]|uniref:type IX secretion system ring protein PorN/GldN n=1 Tax=Saccharicrinis aurantiacus TaxID=1849719 RepID=UPI000838CE9F|nr:gliding motility protein GldN [Saccharicrinis aurantiacus]